MKILVLCLILGFDAFAYEKYFAEASKRFNVDFYLLKSIAKVESNFEPLAINHNSNNSLDIGIMQINSIHFSYLSTFGIKKIDLYDPRININYGAFVLGKCLKTYGITLEGINCYNGRKINNPYAYKVLLAYKEIRK